MDLERLIGESPTFLTRCLMQLFLSLQVGWHDRLTGERGEETGSWVDQSEWTS